MFSKLLSSIGVGAVDFGIKALSQRTIDLTMSELWLLLVLPSVSSALFQSPCGGGSWGREAEGPAGLTCSSEFLQQASELWGAADGAFPLIGVINASLGLGKLPAAGECLRIWYPVAMV